MGCGCKGNAVTPAPVEAPATNTTTVVVPTVQPTSGS